MTYFQGFVVLHVSKEFSKVTAVIIEQITYITFERSNTGREIENVIPKYLLKGTQPCIKNNVNYKTLLKH